MKLNFDINAIKQEAVGQELVKTIAGISGSNGLLLPSGLDDVAVTFASHAVIVMFQEERLSFKICSIGAADRCLGAIFEGSYSR